MKPRRMLALLAVLLVLTSCGILELSVEQQPTGTAPPASPNSLPATQPALPTATSPTQASDPPSPAATTPAEISDPPAATDQPPVQVTEAAPPPAGPQLVKIYLIAVGDNGVSGDLIGCGDSAVPV